MREWKDYEKEELETLIKDTYNLFVTDVSNARNLNPKDHTTFADAHIFTANKAKKVGLIDMVGTISVAQNELIKLSGVTKPVWSKVDKFQKFMENFIQESTKTVIGSFSGLKAY